MRTRVAASIFVAGFAGATLALPTAAQVQPAAPTGEEQADNPTGHGNISVVYLDNYANGMWLTPHFKAPIGTVRNRGIGFDGSYNVSDNWSIYGGIRYFANSLSPPGEPEQNISAWQDVTLGAAWHKRIGNYDFTPSVTANIPSHDYPVVGDAYTGQNLHQLLFAATLSHQFDFTNFYYKIGYGYAFSQHVLGVNTGYQRFDGELGWFVNDRFSVRGFLTGRDGFGLSFADVPAFIGAHGPEVFGAQKTRLAEHSYHAWGLGTDYDFGNRYAAAFSVQRLFWGNVVNDLKYAVEVQLTRNF